MKFFLLRFSFVLYVCWIAALSSPFAYAQSEWRDLSYYDARALRIFAYHDVDDIPFAAHLDYLADHDFMVWPLKKAIKHLNNGKIIPDNVVVLTFDQPQSDVSDIIDHYGFPATAFIAPAAWNGKLPKGLNIQGMPPYHAHIDPKQFDHNLTRAMALLRDDYKTRPTMFAFPFGTHNLASLTTLQNRDYVAAFGMDSGVAYSGNVSNFIWPRYVMSDEYASVDRFAMLARTMPLPVRDVTPQDAMLDNAPAQISFSIHPELSQDRAKLSCYISEGGKAAIEWITPERAILTLPAYSDKRLRVNCIMPVARDPTRWRWFGRLYTIRG